MSDPRVQENSRNEPGLFLGISCIAILVAFQIGIAVIGIERGPARPGVGTVLVGLNLIALGLMFLASFFFDHKTFFFRWLTWICEHLSVPAHPAMALFYFALTFGLGAIFLSIGLNLV